MIVGVAVYAFNKTYNEREISFMDDFTITAHTGSFDTPDNTMESLETAISHNMQVFEIDIRQRPDGTLVMAHDIVANNSDGVELTQAFDRVSQTDMKLNLDIKEVRVLPALYDMITDYGFEERAFLTGIDEHQADKVKQSCPGIAYYINYWPSRIRIFPMIIRRKFWIFCRIRVQSELIAITFVPPEHSPLFCTITDINSPSGLSTENIK